MRGEYSRSTRFAFFKPGSPPLARGVRQLASAQNVYRRITPACAGSTGENTVRRSFFWDHPRLRGEYLKPQKFLSMQLGSPPLARGVPRVAMFSFSVFRITPACAGSTLSVLEQIPKFWDHPRLRGEYDFMGNLFST